MNTHSDMSKRRGRKPNIIQMKPALKVASMRAYCTVSDDVPTGALLKTYRHLWEVNQLWLAHLPNIPNPRREPYAAIDAARAMLHTSEQVGAIEKRMAA